MSTWEPGRNAGIPMSTVRPPLTLWVIVPWMGWPLSNFSLITPQVLILAALSRERIKLSSSPLLSTRTSISSPTLTVMFPLASRSSLAGIIPSVLEPTSTMTKSALTCTTLPVTISPERSSCRLCSYRAEKPTSSSFFTAA